MGHLVLKAKTHLDNLEVGGKIEESDFSTLTEQGNFCQFEYVEDEDVAHGEIAKPGIFSLANR
jgi:hypothetical protein